MKGESKSSKVIKFFNKHQEISQIEAVNKAVELYGLSKSTVFSLYSKYKEKQETKKDSNIAKKVKAKEEYNVLFKGKPRQKFLFDDSRL